MVFHTDLHRFVSSLKERLGPQLQNIPLLYHGVPELHDLLAQYDISIETPNESLLTAELRARFQSLVENVFSVIAETRLFALFLDDLHEADDSYVFIGFISFPSALMRTFRTLDLISTLVNSRSRMVSEDSNVA